MGDTSVTKVSAKTAPKGSEGQRYLAAGVRMGMRLWENEPPTQNKPTTSHEYETIGYVISGHAELVIEGQTVRLDPGDSYVIPKGSTHTFRISESLTAVEATSPPAVVHDHT
ncbi:MAG: cupin domain-containing protein [Chloroflexota bacterium]|nr:cupin domain-containing protein [Chloroflexota bacterium]